MQSKLKLKRGHLALCIIAATTIGIAIPASKHDALVQRHLQADQDLLQLNQMATHAKQLQKMAVSYRHDEAISTIESTLAEAGIANLQADQLTLTLNNADPSKVFNSLEKLRTNAGAAIKTAKISVAGDRISGQVELQLSVKK